MRERNARHQLGDPADQMTLPQSFERMALEDADPSMFAGIIVYPRSSGSISIPGQYSRDSRPRPFHSRITSTATDNSGVEVETVETGTPENYVVRVDVRNHRDSPSAVKLFWNDEGPPAT